MCTAISFKGKHHYFGRNLDVDMHYGEKIVIAGRNFPFEFRFCKTKNSHYAIIGPAVVIGGYPLYFDAVNEKGLGIAGLNFPENAVYYPISSDKVNVAPFELIPYILSDCAAVKDAVKILSAMNLANVDFSENLKLSPLHWIISDRNESVTVEATASGMKIYENEVGVLTNNPEFPSHIASLPFYSHLTGKQPSGGLFDSLSLPPSSLGLGSVGLPGDFTSPSRFVRAAFVKQNTKSGINTAEEVSSFFHMLDIVSVPVGCMLSKDGKSEFTSYSSCCDTDDGVYYYKTYNSCRIAAVDMKKENLDLDGLVSFEMVFEPDINFQNR